MNKLLLATAAFSLMAVSANAANTVTDPRDNQTYPVVNIGGQDWMGENLRYKAKDSYCLYDNEENCKMFRIYSYESGKNACPDNWHAATFDDWATLSNVISEEYKNTKKYDLKENGEFAWDKILLRTEPFQNPTDPQYQIKPYFLYDYKGKKQVKSPVPFNAYHAGFRSPNGSYNFKVGLGAAYWVYGTDGEGFEADANYFIYMKGNSPEGKLALNIFNPGAAMPVRCVSNVTMFTDSRDKQKYPVIDINDKKWMAKNLDFKMKKTYCKDNKPTNCKKYGRMYDRAEALTACPAGWHLPTKSDFDGLLNAAGNSGDAQSIALRHKSWDENIAGTDKLGFAALDSDDCVEDGQCTTFWGGVREGDFHYSLSINSYDIFLFDSENGGNPHYIRCVMD